MLREEVGLAGKAGKGRFERAMIELQTPAARDPRGCVGAGRRMGTAMTALTTSVFDVRGRFEPAAAAAKYVATALNVTAAELGRAFAWPVADARTALDGGRGAVGRRAATSLPVRC